MICEMFFFVFEVGFTTKDVVYKWISSTSTEAVEQDPGLTTSEFDIGPIRIFESATMYKTGKWIQVMADEATLRLQKSWLSPHFLSALKLPNNVAYPARLRSTSLLDNRNRKFPENSQTEKFPSQFSVSMKTIIPQNQSYIQNNMAANI